MIAGTATIGAAAAIGADIAAPTALNAPAARERAPAAACAAFVSRSLRCAATASLLRDVARR